MPMEEDDYAKKDDGVSHSQLLNVNLFSLFMAAFWLMYKR